MSLETGTYIITNLSTKTPIGAVDDAGPDPIVKVVNLPHGVQAPFVSPCSPELELHTYVC